MSDLPSISQPPLNLLVNPKTARRGKPWEIDISDLLTIFIDSISNKGNPDLRLCGTAALSSALIYRFKVETLFYFEKLKIERPKIHRQGPPSVIVLPFRYELYSTSIDDLINTLERIIEEASKQDAQKQNISELIDSEPRLELDQFVVKIEELVKDFRQELVNQLHDVNEILFSELTKNKSILDRAKSFILLLFVAVEGLVILEQLDSDIIIKRGNVIGK
jgi:segregation and condensation protein A|tara:strand:- start:16 stop:675 length:660 start_codon:yes stop_codon:yes gene_type:complete